MTWPDSDTALHTPCHTQDSVCYFLEDGTGRAVFTGDTLFIAGSGRFFEGTPEEMDTALNKILGSLPPDTKVYVPMPTASVLALCVLVCCGPDFGSRATNTPFQTQCSHNPSPRHKPLKTSPKNAKGKKSRPENLPSPMKRHGIRSCDWT